MSAIDIAGVSRLFGETTALAGVDLTIRDGEFFSLLGPSGCGKTTLLNIVAGFLAPTTGTVRIGGRDITALPPYRRDIGMVFQNYALFPHLSVADNVAYGLSVRKRPAAESRRRVEEVLNLVKLNHLADRMPHQLSGGQQQRVAIARALAVEPQVLLLDEPLSNLDAKLRKEMQSELRSLQRRVGITTVLVTHDQEEALSLSDRIGILGAGHLQQIGSPLELYRRPANRFVAEFVGQANLLEATPSADGTAYDVATHHVVAGTPLRLHTGASADTRALLMLRPERIRVEHTGAPAAAGAAEGSGQHTDQPNRAHGILRDASYTGASLRLVVELRGGGDLIVQAPDTAFPDLPAQGLPLALAWDADDIVVLDRGTTTIGAATA
jgi:putative spermidine/putrescine transport system ATP-binding protein